MAREFLGTGFRFPLVPDATGALGWSSGDANVEQSLQILLMTVAGERVMRGEFGTDAERMVFAPGSERYLRMLETTIEEAVRDWESRVDLVEVRAEAEPNDATHVLVSIAYRVRQSNTRHSMVFPFYVGRAEAR
jgi:phage baseplate assembly protein W